MTSNYVAAYNKDFLFFMHWTLFVSGHLSGKSTSHNPRSLRRHRPKQGTIPSAVGRGSRPKHLAKAGKTEELARATQSGNNPIINHFIAYRVSCLIQGEEEATLPFLACAPAYSISFCSACTKSGGSSCIVIQAPKKERFYLLFHLSACSLPYLVWDFISCCSECLLVCVMIISLCMKAQGYFLTGSWLMSNCFVCRSDQSTIGM